MEFVMKKKTSYDRELRTQNFSNMKFEETLKSNIFMLGPQEQTWG